jgi:hypothetical protein
MQLEESAPKVLTLSPGLYRKLELIQKELGTSDLNDALDKSLNIAHFVKATLDDPDKKLLVEQRGRYEELKGIV